MIKFNDGKILETSPYFMGTVCTIYDAEPNTSGFFFGGMDCSDFCTLYRQGEGYYQLSNNGRRCEDEMEEVLSKEQFWAIQKQITLQKKIFEIKEIIIKKKEELSETDYIIIKKVEGIDISEYDMEAIKFSRQQLRDEINRLEIQLQKAEKEKEEE